MERIQLVVVSDNTDAKIMEFIRADLADLNKKAGITSLLPRHYDSKRGNIYCDWMYRHTWSANKGYMQNTTPLCPLVERCGCPCEAKIEETPGCWRAMWVGGGGKYIYTARKGACMAE